MFADQPLNDRTVPTGADPAKPEQAAAPAGQGTFSSPKVVFALHGIRTHADWQRAFGHVANNFGWRCSTDRWNYGYFSLVHFFLHFQRLAKVKWFRQTYHEEMHDVDFKWTPGSLPCVVAHSFGTYILGNALLKYDWLRFDKVILCGSILPTDFPWDKLLAQGRVQAVRNEYGTNDFWTKNVDRFIHGTGPSGRVGFSVKAERLEQEEFDYDHSEYFDKGHMEAKWMPFLERKLPAVPHRPERIARPHSRIPVGFWLIYLTLFVLLGWGVYVWKLKSPPVVNVQYNLELGWTATGRLGFTLQLPRPNLPHLAELRYRLGNDPDFHQLWRDWTALEDWDRGLPTFAINDPRAAKGYIELEFRNSRGTLLGVTLPREFSVPQKD